MCGGGRVGVTCSAGLVHLQGGSCTVSLLPGSPRSSPSQVPLSQDKLEATCSRSLRQSRCPPGSTAWAAPGCKAQPFTLEWNRGRYDEFYGSQPLDLAAGGSGGSETQCGRAAPFPAVIRGNSKGVSLQKRGRRKQRQTPGSKKKSGPEAAQGVVLRMFPVFCTETLGALDRTIPNPHYYLLKCCYKNISSPVPYKCRGIGIFLKKALEMAEMFSLKYS